MMQQTEKYQLNLIETSDTFSPAPLNENMEKLEAAIAADSTAGAEADAALDSRVTVLEGHKIVAGTYTGNGAASQTINLGFTPRLVIAPIGTIYLAMAVTAFSSSYLKIVDGGFQAFFDSSLHSNAKNITYPFLAIK